jgi:hypothetical protein
VIKIEKFGISNGLYAVDLDSLKTEWHEFQWRNGRPPSAPEGTWRCTVQAVWFRRRRRVTVSCIGELWDSQTVKPETALEFLAAHDDGRYGGSTEGRWDGSGYWGSQVSLEEQEAHLAVLRPMLANYPAVPAGYDGWWRF